MIIKVTDKRRIKDRLCLRKKFDSKPNILNSNIFYKLVNRKYISTSLCLENIKSEHHRFGDLKLSTTILRCTKFVCNIIGKRLLKFNFSYSNFR